MDHLESSYEVSVADVRGALERQGMSEDDLRDGDANFTSFTVADAIRTEFLGTSRHKEGEQA